MYAKNLITMPKGRLLSNQAYLDIMVITEAVPFYVSGHMTLSSSLAHETTKTYRIKDTVLLYSRKNKFHVQLA